MLARRGALRATAPSAPAPSAAPRRLARAAARTAPRSAQGAAWSPSPSNSGQPRAGPRSSGRRIGAWAWAVPASHTGELGAFHQGMALQVTMLKSSSASPPWPPPSSPTSLPTRTHQPPCQHQQGGRWGWARRAAWWSLGGRCMAGLLHPRSGWGGPGWDTSSVRAEAWLHCQWPRRRKQDANSSNTAFESAVRGPRGPMAHRLPSLSSASKGPHSRHCAAEPRAPSRDPARGRSGGWERPGAQERPVPRPAQHPSGFWQGAGRGTRFTFKTHRNANAGGPQAGG